MGLVIGGALIGGYPLAATAGMYVVGEYAAGRSANKRAALWYTALAAYGQTFFFVGFGVALRGTDVGKYDDAPFYAAVADAATKPFLLTFVYNRIKQPAPAAARGVSVSPFVSTSRDTGDKALRYYGLTVGF